MEESPKKVDLIQDFKYVGLEHLVAALKEQMAKIELEIHALRMTAMMHGSFELKIGGMNGPSIEMKIELLKTQIRNLEDHYNMILV